MKKTLIFLPIFCASLLLLGCSNNSDELEYTHEAYMAMLTKRSLEPAPYVNVLVKSVKDGQKGEDEYTYTNNEWMDEFGRFRTIDTVVDDAFFALYYDGDDLQNCHFYATETEYRIIFKNVTFEGEYQGIKYTKFSAENHYDEYGMPTGKSYTFLLEDSTSKVTLKETFIYA